MTTVSGIHFTSEQTGGGCAALVAQMEGGTIVLTDGNLYTNVYDLPIGCSVEAAWFAGTSWTDEDQRDATHDVSASTPEVAVSALLAAVTVSQAPRRQFFDVSRSCTDCDHAACFDCLGDGAHHCDCTYDRAGRRLS